MSRFEISGLPRVAVADRSLTKEEKERYVEVISKLLGLPADATVERITPAVADKVDEFLSEAARCTKRFNNVSKIFLALAQGNLIKVAKNVFKAYIDELKKSEANYISLICYSTLKRQYAQAIQDIFFYGGIGGIQW